MTLRLIDDGYDFKVVLVDDSWVFRVPRREGVLEALETELAILPLLAQVLPIDVPRFELVSREPPFVAYRLLHGEPLVDEDSSGVRAFLAALHAIDPESLPLEPRDWVADYRARCAELERAVLPLLDAAERTRARDLFAEAETLTGFRPALVHGDLLPEHLLVRDGRLGAVIDWGDARVGDPALDYAWLLHGPFPGWDVDADLRRRARFYHRLEPWFEAHYGIVVESREHLERGLATIRESL
jgi:aminoglycoside phosphotransferase (APT) family kinase protein